MDLSKRIREFRVSVGYSAAEVARAVGLSPSRMNAIETTPASVQINTLDRLARFYRTPLWLFVGRLTGELGTMRHRIVNEGPVWMQQTDDGAIILRERDAAGPVVARFVPEAGAGAEVGAWVHVEERQNAPAGVRRVVRARAQAENGGGGGDDV